jgi:hypothetical protein
LVSAALKVHRGHLSDPLESLRCLGGREIAACVGAIIAARHQGIPVLLDGFATTIAAGIVHAVSPEAVSHCLASHITQRPAHEAALERIEGSVDTRMLVVERRIGVCEDADERAGMMSQAEMKRTIERNRRWTMVVGVGAVLVAAMASLVPLLAG